MSMQNLCALGIIQGCLGLAFRLACELPSTWATPVGLLRQLPGSYAPEVALCTLPWD